MGLDSASVKFLCAAKSMGVDFTTTAMIGRQGFWPDRTTLQRVFSTLGIQVDADEFLRENNYAEPFFALLGSQRTESLDASAYEGAGRIHDLNKPIDDDLREQFTTVHDGGSLEHVFNIPQAFKNCMQMVKLGGYFIQVAGANNFMGHGFWQFSPELIYRVFSSANGFQVRVVLLHEIVRGGAWHLVADPEQVRMRVELCNPVPTYIMTVAKRVAITEIFAAWPQQSDYVPAWHGTADVHPHFAKPPTGLRGFVPAPVKKAIRQVLQPLGVMKTSVGFFQDYYHRVDEEALLRGELSNQRALVTPDEQLP